MEAGSSSCSAPPPPPAHSALLLAAGPTVLPRLGYDVLFCLMLIVTVLSVFNNCLVIGVILRNPSLLRPMNALVLSLAVSDLMVGLCGSLVVTVTNSRGSFFIGHAACVLQGFAVNYFGLVSLWTLTLLAYERYSVACKGAASRPTVRRCSLGLLFVWVFCLFWAMAPLFGWSSYGPEGVQTSCALAWEERSWSNYSYLLLYTLLCFLLPITGIVFCYSKVLASMNKLNRSVELQGGGCSQKENVHAARMVGAMITAFLVCWLPYAALSLVVVVDPELHISPLVATIPMYFAKTSPVYNPIIYFFSNKQFREAALEVLSCGRHVPHGHRVGIHASSLSRETNAHSRVSPV
ncbi:parietopsin [Betta splendens]|uniref:Parietopsin n=1 Tax=Betta splendens TaxID=158456 RepID=A0A6P7MNS7_BETSP|nr:parietopsin [Betta splendens]